MGVISKPRCNCCSCFESNEDAKQSANFPAPSYGLSFHSTADMLSSVPPVHCPFGTASGLNSAVMWEKAPMPAPNRFTFREIPPAGGSNYPVMCKKTPVPAPNHFPFREISITGRSNYAVMHEKAPVPSPNRFTFGEIPTPGRSNYAVMHEKAPVPAPNRFTFGVSPTVDGSNSVVMPEKAPTRAPFTFGVSPTAGRLEQQDWGKSKCTGTFESAAPIPSLFSMSETPAFHSASHSLFHQIPKGPSFGDLFRANTTTPIPSPFAASGQYPAIKDSFTHGPPPNNLFAKTQKSILQNRLSKLAPSILNRQFPKPTSIFTPPAENPLQNQIPFANAPECTTAPIFSWTTLPGFSASSTSENCRKERIIPFAPTRFPSEGPFAVLHSISALPGNECSSHEELRWEHYQNNPMLGKVLVMMLPVIPMAGGGFAILTVQSNLAQPSTIHRLTEGRASLTFPSGYKP